MPDPYVIKTNQHPWYSRSNLPCYVNMKKHGKDIGLRSHSYYSVPHILYNTECQKKAQPDWPNETFLISVMHNIKCMNFFIWNLRYGVISFIHTRRTSVSVSSTEDLLISLVLVTPVGIVTRYSQVRPTHLHKLM
jgi:hypothetical protein